MTVAQDTRPQFVRHPVNPVLQAKDWPYPVNTVFNAGAVRMSSDTLLLCRIESRTGISHLSAARSPDGQTHWAIDEVPTLSPDAQNHPEEAWGLEDPRIVYLEDLEQYAITYTSYSFRGPGVSLALTRDFKQFERLGQVLPIENKDAALLTRKVNDRYAMVHRPVPVSVGGAHIWISFSPDLRHWGDHQLILPARDKAYWDGSKIGLSPPPIDTTEGWLVLYHAARSTVAGCNYYVGAALLDRDDPTHLIARADEWFFGPEAPYERTGDVDNVVFPCGYTVDGDGDTLNLYYGAADTCIALASGSLAQLLAWVKSHAE